MDWKNQFQIEIQRAEQALAKGNEGMSRVCARRAAGLAIQEYLMTRSLPPGRNAFQNLLLLTNISQIDPQIIEVAKHFLMRVKTDFSLPVEIDLIKEAQWLAFTLFNTNEIDEQET
jgi:hypothetical protein